MANFKDLFFRDSISKNLLISYEDNGTTYTLNNSDYRENMQLIQSICTEQTMRYGCPSPSEFRIGISAENAVSLLNKEITVSIILNKDESDPFQLGKYKVASETLSSNRKTKTIVAYDKMHEIFNTDVAEWYNTILPNEDSTVTFQAFCNSFLNYFGLEAKNLPNNNNEKIIKKTIQPTQLSGKDVLSCICEFSARFCLIGYDGKIDFFSAANGVADDITKSNYITARWEDYNVEPITKVHIQNADGDIGGSYGDGDNVYIVNNNFLCYGMEQEELNSVARSIYQYASLITYTPFDLSLRGNPVLLPGSALSVTTNNGTLNTIVFNRTLKGIQSLRDTFSAEGTRTQPEVSNSIGSSVTQLKGKTNQLQRDIYETKSTITDVERGLSSQITQNADSIRSEVTRATDAENLLNTKITQTDENLRLQVSKLQKEIDGDIVVYNVDEAPTLYNYPAYNFTSNIRVGETFILNPGLRFEYDDETYRKYARTVAFDTRTNITYKFAKGENDVWFWKEVADSDFSYVMQQLSEINIEIDNITSTVEANKQYSDGEFTKLSSRVTQEADRITSEVTRATSAEGTLSSRITQTATSLESQISATKTEVKTYADGKANTAESNAKSDTTERLKSYSTTVQMDSAIKQSADSIVASVNKSITETKEYADNSAKTAESNAKTDTTNKLKSYSTTAQMNTAIKLSADSITSSVDKSITETREYADSKASTAQANAIADTTNKLKSYSTTTQMNSAIKQSADSINASVSKSITETKTYADGKASTAESNAKADTTEKLKSYSTTTEMNAALKINTDAITAEVNRATNAETQLTTRLSIQADQIQARVLKTGGSDKTFAWSLTTDGFKLISNNKTVMNVTKDGMTIDGYATANQLNSVSGKIDTLSSKAITTDNLSSQSISAGQITSGRISTSHLDTKVITTDNFSAQSVSANQINVTNLFSESISGSQSLFINAVWTNGLYLYDGATGRKESFSGVVTTTIGGVSYRLVGRRI